MVFFMIFTKNSRQNATCFITFVYVNYRYPNISNDRSLVNGVDIDHIESPDQKLASIHHELSSIHGHIVSTAQTHDNGQEVINPTGMATFCQSSPRINVYENILFAGGDGDYSILSVLFGAHSIGGGIFGYLTMIDSNKMRLL